MATSPSSQMLKILQQAIKQRKENTASLAEKTGIPRKSLKRILSGQEDLTVDAMIILGEALRIDATLLQQLGIDEPAQLETPKIKVATQNDFDWRPNPYGNHHEQLIRMGFELGIDFWLIFDSTLLKNSGVPKHVLAQFNPRLQIKLEAKFHPYNEPQFESGGLGLRLSFDALYSCLFPWNSIIKIIFEPQTFVPDDEPEAEKETEDKPKPFLRVVK